ncbi:MAG: signal transduction chemotaxis protein [Proteobacteria bacterium]|nr:signal transduction chemotaxis protein [Pseudomonadota bacterium]
MNTELQLAAAPRSPVVAKSGIGDGIATGQPYLAFRLAGEVYAIDILRIREIIEYTPPTTVPMMPPSLRGVINLRGAVVPVIDLAVRFGREATGVGKRTCFVIVEVEHEGATHVLGLMVDGVNAVMEIGAADIEPPPSFGTRVNAEFIAGMARVDGRFVIILDIARVLSIEEMAAIKSVDRAD